MKIDMKTFRGEDFLRGVRWYLERGIAAARETARIRWVSAFSLKISIVCMGCFRAVDKARMRIMSIW
jgi:hypothetical protein